MVPRIYSDNRSAEIIEGFDRLRDQGLVGKIVVLDSSRDNSIKHDADLTGKVDVEVKRREMGRKGGVHPRTLECGTNEPEGFKEYCDDISSTAIDHDINLVMPTSDMGVFAVSYCLRPELRVSPDMGLVNLMQNKAETYDFMSRNGFRAPDYMSLELNELGKLSGDVQDFMAVHGGLVFAKPSVPQLGGGVGASQVGSYAEICDLMQENSSYPSYLLSEMLYGSEINHTVVLNEDGSVNTQCSYRQVLENGGNSGKRVSIRDEALEMFGNDFGRALRKEFPNSRIRGPYNVDFMEDSKGDLVLSEVNPGRMPGGLGVFRGNGYNIIEPVVRSFLDDGLEYSKVNNIGTVYSG